MKHAKENIKDSVKNPFEKLENKENFAKILGAGYKDVAAVQKATGFSKETSEGIYNQGYLLYNTGRFKEAADIFHLLTTMNPAEPKYLMGLAACHHMRKDYSKGASLYNLVSLLDPQNPIPFFHASDCYFQIGDKVGAATMLEMAIKRAGSLPQYAMLKQRCEITLSGLKKELTAV